MAGYVLDTSAIMTVIYDEEGTQQVKDVLRTSERVLVPFLSLMEVHYKVLRERPDDLDEALSIIRDWPAITVESNDEWREVAAGIKAGGGLSVVDAWAAALAIMEDAELVHKDPEFERVADLKMLKLPYKLRGTRS